MRLSLSLFTILILALAGLSACHGLNIQEHGLQAYPDMPHNAQPAAVSFKQLRYHIPTGSSIATTSPKGALGLFLCGSPYSVMQKGMIGRTFVDDNLKQIFTDTLETQGYDVTGDPGMMFDEAEDEMRATYSIGARVTNIRMDLCNRRSFVLGHDRGYIGEGEMSIEWTVFDLLHRRNVLKLKTNGYTKLSVPNYEGIQLIAEEAFAAAVHNLGADEDFRNLVVFGHEPETLPETAPNLDEVAIGVFDPSESVVIQNSALSKISASERLGEMTKTAVLIEAGHSHGSGFFITEQGHILTNAHVVGNALRVRVVTSGKKEKLIGEVLRTNRKRDVALIRLESVPDDLKIKTLPIRTEKPNVGGDVYAIGTPRYKKLQDTVTKGIVSAHRYDRRERQPYIQADVDIYGGNSGGPLLDANGNIIGISAKGYFVDDGRETLGGLNWFIPIEDALKELHIQLQ